MKPSKNPISHSIPDHHQSAILVHCSHAQLVDVTELVANPRNPNKHSDKQVALLAKIIRHQGWRSPITVSNRSGFVVTGHGRLQAAILLGEQLVPVDRQDFASEADEWAHLVADNRIAELADADKSMIADLLKELDSGGLDMDLTGFDMDALDELLAEVNPPDITEDEVPDVPVDPITQPGDLWILGEHRVMCGDSTKAEDVERLMAGATVEMMFTDPPYGVDYSGGVQFDGKGGATTNNRERLKNDETTAIYPAFLPVALSAVDGPCYMWFADSKARDVYNAVHDNGCEVHALIIWHKTNATYAAMNAQYKQRHEPCLYFKPRGSTLRWCGETTEATVWSQDRDGINEFHPTQKPIALAAKAIKNHEAATVLDMFCGSGSTLIAAEQLGRKCYGMEISPAYCDVIVKRWETLTGKKAVLAND